MIVHTNTKEIKYPCGLYLYENRLIIEKMAIEVAAVYPNKDINLWCKGSSGSIIAGMMACMLNDREIIINHVKKSGEESHSEYMYSVPPDSINVVVDDFIRSGETIFSIVEHIKRKTSKNTVDCLCISGDVYEKYQKPGPTLDYIRIDDVFKTIIASKTFFKN